MSNNIDKDLEFEVVCYIGCGYKEDTNQLLNKVLKKFNNEIHKKHDKKIL